ncbi:uncharacterized protein LOC132054364 [Lycium ferocissimum]|uniref:uncharacterized protein LOC132054364 n=1 Tax=Lycium ferocissimum TaxID=112874 RepID=UPI002814D32D|nr:uncharacterized protein LOC132054364 [Lycium ferocissimum]
MDNSQKYSSLSCEIQIIRARNVEQRSLGSSLFVRCYLSAGEDQRVQINSQEIVPSKSYDLFWDESFSLDCSGTEDSINNLKQGSVVFELHSKKILPILGKVGGSQILGRAEIPWTSVFESTNMEIVEWAIMGSEKRHLHEDVKPMAVQIAMTVSVKETTKVKKNDNLRSSSWDNKCACMDYCGCNSSNILSADDYEVFALGAVLGAL